MLEKRKKICVLVLCYNEEKSVLQIYQLITEIFSTSLKYYDYDIVFVDDFSRDNTREIIRNLCDKDTGHVNAVFNAANFGLMRNTFSAFKMAEGDAAFLVFGDLQDPPQLLPQFIKEWEAGKKVVIGQKTGSNENKIMFFMRMAL